MLLLLTLFACDLEKYGAYDCDAYCGQILDKTEECAQYQADQECAELGDSACAAISESDVADYAAQSREDWAGATRQEMVSSCKSDLEASGKSDVECQAETAAVNNITCEQLLDLIGGLDG